MMTGNTLAVKDMDDQADQLVRRSYQVDLLGHGIKKNTIVCLGTGTGKTFITVMLIKELANQVKEPYTGSGKRTIFLVPTVNLVIQQTEVIEKYVCLKVKGYYGEMGVDSWSKEVWQKEFIENQVLIMTAEIFRVILTQGFMPVSKVNLLILDECHSTKKESPYREIMRCFDNCPDEEQPLVLGLNASLANNKCKPSQVTLQIRNLEEAMRSAAKTADTEHYGMKPNEFLQCAYNASNKFADSDDLIKAVHRLGRLENFLANVNQGTLCKEGIRSLKPLVKCIESIKFILDTMGPWCTQKMAEICQLYIHSLVSKLVEFRDSDFMSRLLLLLSTEMAAVSALCKSYMGSEPNYEGKVLKFASDKLKKLSIILKACYNKHEDDSAEKMPQMRGIVFVQRRDVAVMLNLWINALKGTSISSNVSSCYVVGHGDLESVALKDEMEMSAKRQSTVLNNFRNGTYNLVVASSVVEGLDVPQCNLVVHYDDPTNFSSYIHCKGRAKAKPSNYFMMREAVKKDEFFQQLQNYQEVEQEIRKLADSQTEPGKSEEVDKSLDDLKDVPEENKIYLPDKADGAPCITLTSAISIIYRCVLLGETLNVENLERYCLQLPSDTFTQLLPEWEINEVEGETLAKKSFICTLTLPINSYLRQQKGSIQGIPMRRKKLAKKSAALEACKELHKIGELNENLVLIDKSAIKLEDESEEDDYDDGNVEGKPGTKKRRQKYPKKVPGALMNCLPQSGTQCYLYVFKMKLTFALPDEYNSKGRKLHDPADTTKSFGILSTKAFPPICQFPLFTASGELNIAMELVTSESEFTDIQLKKLSSFHRFIFDDVLNIHQYDAFYDHDCADSNYFVVPVDMKNAVSSKMDIIDWNIINAVLKFKKQQGIDQHEKNFSFRPEDYVDALITPWYREPQSLYYVTGICNNMNPRSKFPNHNFDSFEHYFQDKYEITVKNHEQPLLEVVGVRKPPLNMLTPHWYASPKGVALPKKEKKDKREQKQHLIPEMCVVQPLPASLWMKARCLPSLLYRISSLLLAEELRKTIARETRIGCIELNGTEWPRLDFGWTLEEALKSKGKEVVGNPEPMQCEPDYNSSEDLEKTMTSVESEQDDDELLVDNTGDGLERAKDSSQPSIQDPGYRDSDSTDTIYLDMFPQLACFVKQEEYPSSDDSSTALDTDNESMNKRTDDVTEMKCQFVAQLEDSLSSFKDVEMKPVLHNKAGIIEDKIKFYGIHSDSQKYVVKTSEGPGPGLILQALTTSNAGDGFDLECLKTIGESFLKYKTTEYLFVVKNNYHEGHLSLLRKQQVCNKKLCNLGKKKGLEEFMHVEKFEPQNNWLPPCYRVKTHEERYDLCSDEELDGSAQVYSADDEAEQENNVDWHSNQLTHQTIADKSIADCVEALIGAYLMSCGHLGALHFMKWLGLKVLLPDSGDGELYCDEDGCSSLPSLKPPLLRYIDNPEEKLMQLYAGMDNFEEQIGYVFKDKAYLVSAFTHSSYTSNHVTDCYQKLEFLGEAVLDYLITHHIYKNPRVKQALGALADLRSALVSSTFFASLAVRNGYHKYLKMQSPELFNIIRQCVNKILNEASVQKSGVHYLEEEECENAEEVEVPKVLGDIFESVAGAIYLDSGMSLDVVWKVYYAMMKPEIEYFSTHVPKSPISELLEMEPQAAKFERAEIVAGRKVRVVVSVFGKGRFVGIGRNKRIAKNAAAKRALRALKRMTKEKGESQAIS